MADNYVRMIEVRREQLTRDENMTSKELSRLFTVIPTIENDNLREHKQRKREAYANTWKPSNRNSDPMLNSESPERIAKVAKLAQLREEREPLEVSLFD